MRDWSELRKVLSERRGAGNEVRDKEEEGEVLLGSLLLLLLLLLLLERKCAI